jgi:hypothetical protein
MQLADCVVTFPLLVSAVDGWCSCDSSITCETAFPFIRASTALKCRASRQCLQPLNECFGWFKGGSSKIL